MSCYSIKVIGRIPTKTTPRTPDGFLSIDTDRNAPPDPGGVSYREIPTETALRTPEGSPIDRYRPEPHHRTPEGSPIERYRPEPHHRTPEGSPIDSPTVTS